MVKGWRILFYTLIGLAVGCITFITVKYILTERLVKNTGDAEPEVRRAAALRVMQPFLSRDEDKPIEFLARQPQTVRDNVVWSLEALLAEGHAKADEAVLWLVRIARDLSGPIPGGDAESDAARLAVMRLGQQAVEPLIETLAETTERTLERDKYANRRKVAARLLGIIGDERAVEPLIAALRDDYSEVRQQAAAALARIDTPAANEALDGYLEPLLAVLEGRYMCWIRADSEGRVRRDLERDDLIYGPFYIQVKPQNLATEEDLQRQRDSAERILEAEAARAALTKQRMQEGRHGKVIKPNKKDPPNLQVTAVRLMRYTEGDEQLVVADPAARTTALDVVEGEPISIEVDVQNVGPGDVVNDFFVTLYAASPRPRSNIDRPTEGEFEGEPARDRRALSGTADARHVRTLYAQDRAETPDDDTRATLVLTKQFNTVEADRIDALERLMAVGHESCIAALGQALDDPSYTVRQQATLALAVILDARRTSGEAKERIVRLLIEKGVTSDDPVVRYHAVDALEASDDAATVATLAALLLNDTNQTVRLAATRALAGRAEADREPMLPALVASDPEVRLVAPRLFQNEGDEEIAVRLLFSPDPAVPGEVLRSANRLLGSEHLIAAMQLPDPRVRAAAARLLAARRDPAAQEALLRALSDVDGKVRAAAARGLGYLLADSSEPSREVIAALAQVIEDEAGDYVGVAADDEPEDSATAVTTDKQSRAAATEALVGLRNLKEIPEARAAVLDALEDKHPDVLAAVIPAVARGDLGNRSERLIAVIKDVLVPARVRQAAELAMWASGCNDEDSLDALVGLLNDPNEAVKTAAAVSLIGLGDKRGQKVLRDQITSKVPEVRREAAKLMATLPQADVDKIRGLKDEDRDGMGILFEDLYREGSLAVNFRFLCGAMIFLDDHRADTAALMGGKATDPHPVLRAAAVTVLAGIGDERAGDLVRHMLDDESEFVRAAAADAAAVLRLDDVRPKLRALSSGADPDPSERVRNRAAVALGRMEVGAI